MVRKPFGDNLVIHLSTGRLSRSFWRILNKSKVSRNWPQILGFAFLFVVVGCTHEKSSLGEQYFIDGEYEKAIEEYTKVIKIKPRAIEEIYNRGRAYQELGQEQNAIDDFKRVLELNPDHVQAHLSLGNIDFQKNDFEKAFYQFNKVVE